MMFDVDHKTHYRYSLPVVQSQHMIHMTPRTTRHQTIVHHSLMIEPAPSMRQEGLDVFGNRLVFLEIEVPHKDLVVHARSTVQTHPGPPADPSLSVPLACLDKGIAGIDRGDALDVIRHQCPSRLTVASREIMDYARSSFHPDRPLLEAAADLNRRIFQDFTFDATATDVSTPIGEVFKHRRGVCQDFAHLALTCLRAVRVPARYVSGYILTQPPPGQPRLLGADASHAWFSVWSPEAGWTEFDPTNGVSAAGEHIAVAYGRDFDDVSPINGVILGGGEHTVSVAVDVVRTQ